MFWLGVLPAEQLTRPSPPEPYPPGGAAQHPPGRMCPGTPPYSHNRNRRPRLSRKIEDLHVSFMDGNNDVAAPDGRAAEGPRKLEATVRHCQIHGETEFVIRSDRGMRSKRCRVRPSPSAVGA